MHIFFAPVDTSTLQHFNSALTTDLSQKKYYYGLEYGSNPSGFDDILIYDTIGRSVPINAEHIDNLIDALQRLKTFIGIVEQHGSLCNTLYNIADSSQKVGL